MATRRKRDPAPVKTLRRTTMQGALRAVRTHLKSVQGIVPLPCGCYLQVQKTALKSMSTPEILERVCHAAFSCGHDPTYN